MLECILGFTVVQSVDELKCRLNDRRWLFSGTLYCVPLLGLVPTLQMFRKLHMKELLNWSSEVPGC